MAENDFETTDLERSLNACQQEVVTPAAGSSVRRQEQQRREGTRVLNLLEKPKPRILSTIHCR